jgi:hypothetical protein
MTSIPIDRPSDTAADPVPLPTTRVRARSGTLTPVDGSAAVRFDRSAVRDLVRPPDVWSDPRPSLRSLWLYAVYGKWTGERTPSRYAGVAYAALVAMPIHCATYLLNWIVERPARLAVSVVLILLVVLAL